MKTFKTLLTGLFLMGLISVALNGCTAPKPTTEEVLPTEQKEVLNEEKAPVEEAQPEEKKEETQEAAPTEEKAPEQAQ